MKKISLILLVIMITAMLSACGGNSSSSEINNDQNDTINNSQEETTTVEDSGDSDSVEWPDFLPSEIPAIEDISIVSCYPNTSGASEYTLEITVSKSDKALLDAYATELTSAGFTQDPVQENNFGINYNFSNENYNIFINAVFDGYSKLAITKK